MEGFTIIDAVVAVVIIVSAILAYSRGLMREIMAIAGWIAAAVLAYIFAPRAVPLVKEIPYLNDILGDNCEFAVIAAFAAVGLVALLVVSIFTPLFSSAVQRSALGGVDAILGFVFGVARGVLIIAIAFVLYSRLIGDQAIPLVDDSKTAKIFAQVENQLNEQIPDDAPGWVREQYDALMAKANCTPSRPVTPTVPPAEPAPADGAASDTTNGASGN